MGNKEKFYYHATHTIAAYKIYQYGFRVDKELLMHGDAHGSGVYLSFNEKTLGHWGYKGSIGIKCTLAKRLKTLSLSQGYDKSIIKYLKKEFGKGIVDGMNFHKAIPRNKQLTKREMIALACYIYTERKMNWLSPKRDERDKFWNSQAQLRKHLLRYGFEAISDGREDLWDSDEIVVFNPSNVVAESFHLIKEVHNDKEHNPEFIDLSAALSKEKLKELHDKEKKENEKWERDNTS